MKRDVHAIVDLVREIKRLGARIGCDFVPDDAKLRGAGLTEQEIRTVRLLSRN